MGKLLAGICATLMVACSSPQKPEPQILSVADFQEPTNYLVRFNFVLFDQEIAQNAMVATSFKNALDEWSHHLPIECATMIEKTSIFPFVLFNNDSISSQPGIIKVHIVDICASPYNMPQLVLGCWIQETHTLVLSKDALERDAETAYAVSLHELGHVFGLNHVVNRRDPNALSNWIVVNGANAREMIMYPVCSELNKCAQLSKLEIDLARKNLLHLESIKVNDCFHLTSR